MLQIRNNNFIERTLKKDRFFCTLSWIEFNRSSMAFNEQNARTCPNNALATVWTRRSFAWVLINPLIFWSILNLKINSVSMEMGFTIIWMECSEFDLIDSRNICSIFRLDALHINLSNDISSRFVLLQEK